MADLLERLKAALADHYTIERELGSGGMATVYLAPARCAACIAASLYQRRRKSLGVRNGNHA